jgi:aminoglycoside 6'-N-acetyltransferase I
VGAGFSRLYRMSAKIRHIVEADRADWVRMRDALWPGSVSDHETETHTYFGRRDAPPVFVAEHDGRLIGFLELGYRAYAEGCASSPVPFIEGWYVEPAFQGQGVGRALVEAAEASARADRYTEIASDVLIDNHVSIAAHGALGYEEVERLVCFRKVLSGR